MDIERGDGRQGTPLGEYTIIFGVCAAWTLVMTAIVCAVGSIL